MKACSLPRFNPPECASFPAVRQAFTPRGAVPSRALPDRRVGGFFVGVVVLLLVSACGPQVVRPLDLRSASLSRDSQRYLAAAEDGVVVARAREQAARARLRTLGAQVEHAQAHPLPLPAAAAALEGLLQGRYQVARVQLELALALTELAHHKFRLATAERAMMHDLGRYELKPLQEALVMARKRVESGQESLRAVRKLRAEAADRWWKAYVVLTGDSTATRAFWLGRGGEPLAPLELQTPTKGDQGVTPSPSTTATKGAEAVSEAGKPDGAAPPGSQAD